MDIKDLKKKLSDFIQSRKDLLGLENSLTMHSPNYSFIKNQLLEAEELSQEIDCWEVMPDDIITVYSHEIDRLYEKLL